jgi:hypothetical protein
MWSENSQVVTISYSQFLEYQRQGHVSDLTITNDRSTGRIVEPKEGELERFRTVRVDPKLADRPIARATTA